MDIREIERAIGKSPVSPRLFSKFLGLPYGGRGPHETMILAPESLQKMQKVFSINQHEAVSNAIAGEFFDNGGNYHYIDPETARNFRLSLNAWLGDYFKKLCFGKTAEQNFITAIAIEDFFHRIESSDKDFDGENPLEMFKALPKFMDLTLRAVERLSPGEISLLCDELAKKNGGVTSPGWLLLYLYEKETNNLLNNGEIVFNGDYSVVRHIVLLEAQLAGLDVGFDVAEAIFG